MTMMKRNARFAPVIFTALCLALFLFQSCAGDAAARNENYGEGGFAGETTLQNVATADAGNPALPLQNVGATDTGNSALPFQNAETANTGHPALPLQPVVLTLADHGVTITLPGNLAIVTRNSVHNRQIIEDAGLSARDIRAFMMSTNTWLYAVNSGLDQEFLISGRDGTGREYTDLSGPELEAVADSGEMRRYFSVPGVSGRVYGYYLAPAASWIMIDIRQAAQDRTVYAAEYYTVKQGKAVTITLQSSSGPLTEEQFALLKSAVDSAEFTARAR